MHFSTRMIGFSVNICSDIFLNNNEGVTRTVKANYNLFRRVRLWQNDNDKYSSEKRKNKGRGNQK